MELLFVTVLTDEKAGDSTKQNVQPDKTSIVLNGRAQSPAVSDVKQSEVIKGLQTIKLKSFLS